MLLALGLRLPYLTVPLGIDEGGVSFIAQQWGTGHGSLYGAYWLDRPPLLVGLYKLAVLGGPLGVRALGAVAAVSLVAVVAALGHALGGHRTARVAAVLAAVFSGSIALAAVFSPAELLASVPAAASVLGLVRFARYGDARWLVAAGALAVTAALIKQSFLDAGLAGAVFLSASLLRDARGGLRAVTAYGAGAVSAVGACVLVLLATHVSLSGLAYALFGFRVDALATLSASNLPLHVRARGLLGPVLGSALVAALVLAPAGLWTLRRDRVLCATAFAWLAAAAIGVLAGGSYWPHYLIQLVAPAGTLAAVALTSVKPRLGMSALAAIAALSIAVSAVGAHVVRARQPLRPDLAVATYVRTHARPGDTQYVMYARANLGYYTGLRSPYPFAWSLLVRAIPGATQRLDRLLASPQRPTWLIGWQPPDKWHLDPTGVTRRLLRREYRRVAVVAGRPIYHRAVSIAAPQVTTPTQGSTA